MDRNFKYGYLELDLNKELFYTTNDGELIKEVWKDIPDYEGYYQVSNCGRVKSLERRLCRKTFIMTQTVNNRGYLRGKTTKQGKSRTVDMHKIIATSFLNHKPDGHNKIIDHIDFDPLNNTVSNLQEISNRENCSKDQWRHNRSSEYVGVSWAKDVEKWIAKIKINGTSINLGGFTNETKANNCYQDALRCVNEGRIKDIKRNTRASSSKYKHVSYNTRDKKWTSYLQINNKRKYMGYFITEEEAYQALLNYKKQLL